VIRQLLTESLLVSALGGILGGIIAAWGTELLVALVADGSSGLSLETHYDLRVLAFTAAASLITGILFGLAPAIRATRVDVNRTLAANARGSIGGRGQARTGRILVIAQVSLSLVLLIGAMLFARSLHNVVVQKLGFDRDHLLMTRVDPVAAGYNGATVPALYLQALGKLRTIPGVRSVTLSNTSLFAADSGDHAWPR
jgi:FtsX-like permease family